MAPSKAAPKRSAQQIKIYIDSEDEDDGILDVEIFDPAGPQQGAPAERVTGGASAGGERPQATAKTASGTNKGSRGTAVAAATADIKPVGRPPKKKPRTDTSAAPAIAGSDAAAGPGPPKAGAGPRRALAAKAEAAGGHRAKKAAGTAAAPMFVDLCATSPSSCGGRRATGGCASVAAGAAAAATASTGRAAVAAAGNGGIGNGDDDGGGASVPSQHTAVVTDGLDTVDGRGMPGLQRARSGAPSGGSAGVVSAGARVRAGSVGPTGSVGGGGSRASGLSAIEKVRQDLLACGGATTPTSGRK